MTEIKEHNLGHGDKPDYFSLRGWVSFIKKDGTWCYPANPANKKKVVENGDSWIDESTGSIVEQCERRYILGAVASDHTGSTWVSAFNEPVRRRCPPPVRPSGAACSPKAVPLASRASRSWAGRQTRSTRS